MSQIKRTSITLDKQTEQIVNDCARHYGGLSFSAALRIIAKDWADKRAEAVRANETGQPEAAHVA